MKICRQLKDHRAKPATQRPSARIKRELAHSSAARFAKAVEFRKGRVGQLFGCARILSHHSSDADQIASILTKEIFPRSIVAFSASRSQAQIVGVQRSEKLLRLIARLGGRSGISGGLLDRFSEIFFCRSENGGGHLGIADRIAPLDARKELVDVFFKSLMELVNCHQCSQGTLRLNAGSEPTPR